MLTACSLACVEPLTVTRDCNTREPRRVAKPRTCKTSDNVPLFDSAPLNITRTRVGRRLETAGGLTLHLSTP